MTFPFLSVNADQQLDTRILLALIRQETLQLDTESNDLKKYRDYYDGEQGLVFGTAKFKAQFGDAFANFRDDWCGVIVDAILDKLRFQGVRIGAKGPVSEIEAEPVDAESTEPTDTVENSPDPTLDPVAEQVWEALERNDIDVVQSDIHEGALVEGRSYAIVWPDPDPKLRVRIDANRANMVRVRRADDDPRKIAYAIKRWQSPNGQHFVNIYTPDAIYKFQEAASGQMPDPSLTGLDALAPKSSSSADWVERRVPGETWPLPNPFGVVPVIEFANKRGSELKKVIPIQDAINYLVIQGLSAAGFMGWPQRGFHSGVAEPPGGWSNEPGRVWQLPPTYSADGEALLGKEFQFEAADLAQFRGMVEMLLQHLALATKTPVRMFFQSDRGGRGDAPSGESLLVEDQPLIDKVEDRMARFGNSWYQVVKLMAQMLKLNEDLPPGEVRWKDPRAKYRSALIAEAALMVKDIGLPIQFVITQMGLSAEEVQILKVMLDQKKAEEEAQMEREFEQQVQLVQSRPVTNQPPVPRRS